MADILNLNRARKAKAKADAKKQASENRISFGRTKAERSLEEARRSLEAERLEGHRRDEPKD